MKSSVIRSSFLSYFAERGHKIVPSSPLIPQDDPTLLFTNAGMNQFKGVFQGLEKRDYKTATSSQKCLRAGGKHNDLENVGFTARHNTFFEMLGNFSFGDYFKEEAIAFAWEYVTKTLGLDPKRLYATVFEEDDDAEKSWRKIAPELGDRVLRFGEKDNFWSMGDTGPCGPCSEIHYDRGEKYSGELNGEGDRFMEIWNLVFMQYNRDEAGKLTPLPKPSVDTGAGLERFTMVLQNAETNYETDLFLPIIRKVEEISGISYDDEQRTVSFRVIADHLRALTFAIADGGIISNEGRGYVLRRILRRAARHGRLLDMHEPFLHKLVETLTEMMGEQYPEIRSKRKHIELVLRSEEEQFGRTLDIGLEIFEDIVRKVESLGSKVIPGEDVFKLYDTFGFPPDLTEVMAKERGFKADMEGFERELGIQRKKSQEQTAFVEMGIAFSAKFPATEFEGYTQEVTTSGILWNGQVENKEYLVLDKTPFYPTSGGQVNDTGRIYSDGIDIEVEDVQKQGDSIVHIVKVVKDKLHLLDSAFSEKKKVKLTAEIDGPRRAEIKRNHTATHLLHKALRDVLGDHVHQSGSLVAPDRLRFDFTHFKAMSDDEINLVEKIVREKIKEDLPVRCEYKSLDEAKAMGAMALFGEKYSDTVRVVTTGVAEDPFSIELCGGTHVDHTADIGEFYITQETAIAAGMRRIEAVTGRGAAEFRETQEEIISELSGLMKKGSDGLSDVEVSRYNDLLSKGDSRYLTKESVLDLYMDFSDALKSSQREREKERARRLSEDASNIEPKAVIGEEKIFVYIVPAADAGEVMVYSDKYKNTHRDSSVVTISQSTGNFAITPGPNGIGQEIMKAISVIPGVRGGGKPTVRGTMPVASIETVMNLLKERFSD